MSKAPKNIEKILLGVAVLAAGGLVALGVMKSGAVDEDFEPLGGRGKGEETAVKGAEEIARTVNSVESDRAWAPAEVDSPNAEGGKRPVDLFVGPPTYAQRDKPNEPFDPYINPPIHEGIPNLWWLKYDVPMVYADSPDRDHDGDGFTNREEFEAGTNPSNRNLHPSLVDKLMYVKDDSTGWYVDFGMENAGQWYPRLKDMNWNTINRTDFQAGLKPGDMFFGKEKLAKRFKFIGMEDRVVHNESMNLDQNLRIAMYEDQQENKKGERYEIPNQVPKANRPDFAHYDRTAVLDLQALGLAGKEFKVEERTKFALPPEKEDKEYFLKEVTPDAIVVEWQEDGETKSVTIPQGGLAK